ncbi:MAG: DUF2461 domain-containing protein [Chitinophagales bacterium]
MHFTPAFFKFFAALRKNNNKEWFDANRSTYESEVKEPFKAFVGKLIAELAKSDPELNTNVGKSIFRINRDIRFSKDKSPYKDHAGAFFAPGGTTDTKPGFYLHLSDTEIFVGGGLYHPDREEILKVRQEIFYNPEEFQSLLKAKDFKGIYKELKGEDNKVLPADYKEFAKTQPLIARKQFYYVAPLTRDAALAKDFDKIVLKHFKAGDAMNAFLKRALLEE